MKQITITIDGPAGSGKGTTARLVSQKLGYHYLDSGALYRAAALYLLECGILPTDEELTIKEACDGMCISFDAQGETFLNDKCVSQEIRTPNVSKHVASYATLPHVRMRLDMLQKQLISGGGWVLDGRDAGSVIAPSAELKIYLDCAVAERARRRASERGVYDADGIAAIKQEITERDALDMDPARGPAQLRVLPDAVVVDTTELGIHEQVEEVCRLARDKGID